MPIPKSKGALTALFERLGATEPALWAEGAAEEGESELLRFLFLREAWRRVQSESDHSWIDWHVDMAAKHPAAPYSQLGKILERCRAAGISDQDLTDMARCHQASMIFHMCYVIDAGPDNVPDELEGLMWGLFQVDEDDRPLGDALEALHESVLATDPTGREMRPR